VSDANETGLLAETVTAAANHRPQLCLMNLPVFCPVSEL